MTSTDTRAGPPPWLAPALAAVAWHAALLAVYVAARGGDVSTLVCAASSVAGRPPFEAVRVPCGGGYDGQFCYVLGLNPWTPQTARLDVPAYRHVRVLYPAAASLLSGGDGRRLVWALPLVNLLAAGALAALGAHLAAARGLSPWWGFGLPLAVNDGMGALRDLTDPLAALAVAGLLAGSLLGWGAAAMALWGAAAVFSRQQNALLVGVVLLTAGWSGRRGVAAGLALVLALLGVWVLALRLAYHAWPVPPPDDTTLTRPLVGLVYVFGKLGQLPTFRVRALEASRLAHLFVELGLAAWLLARRCDVNVKAALLAGAALVLTAGEPVYCDEWSYTRIFAWLPLGVWLAGVQLRKRWCLVALLPGGAWALVYVAYAVRAALREPGLARLAGG